MKWVWIWEGLLNVVFMYKTPFSSHRWVRLPGDAIGLYQYQQISVDGPHKHGERCVHSHFGWVNVTSALHIRMGKSDFISVLFESWDMSG